MIEELARTLLIMLVYFLTASGAIFVFLSFYKGGVLTFDWEKFSGIDKIKKDNITKEE